MTTSQSPNKSNATKCDSKTYVRWEWGREFLKLSKARPNIDVSVQQHAQQRLCSTGILDCLLREEDAFRGVKVEFTVRWYC
jgi:hypothetical protein